MLLIVYVWLFSAVCCIVADKCCILEIMNWRGSQLPKWPLKVTQGHRWFVLPSTLLNSMVFRQSDTIDCIKYIIISIIIIILLAFTVHTDACRGWRTCTRVQSTVTDTWSHPTVSSTVDGFSRSQTTVCVSSWVCRTRRNSTARSTNARITPVSIAYIPVAILCISVINFTHQLSNTCMPIFALFQVGHMGQYMYTKHCSPLA